MIHKEVSSRAKVIGKITPKITRCGIRNKICVQHIRGKNLQNDLFVFRDFHSKCEIFTYSNDNNSMIYIEYE